MGMSFFVDESKAKGYLVAAAAAHPQQLPMLRKELGVLLLPGQRSLHMKAENDRRKRQIADSIVRLAGSGLQVMIFDAGRAGTERDRRARCLRALVDEAARFGNADLVFDLEVKSIWVVYRGCRVIPDFGGQALSARSGVVSSFGSVPVPTAWDWAMRSSPR